MQKTNRRERFMRYAPLIFWLGVIFFASSSQGSMSNTSQVIRPLILFFFPGLDEASILAIQVFIRKTAHFTVYFVLGLLSARAFSSSAKEFLQKNWFPVSLCLVVLTASLDETNQSFLSSRTGSVYDVLLDTAGGATALFLSLFLIRLKKRKTKI
ncbi:MAG TPA: VanZ family protein [Pyrinomonadaceae bacterium]|jgi:VanZ family protein|nr:VanZ family protein [Pyrinomonadaceae bacterium]